MVDVGAAGNAVRGAEWFCWSLNSQPLGFHVLIDTPPSLSLAPSLQLKDRGHSPLPVGMRPQQGGEPGLAGGEARSPASRTVAFISFPVCQVRLFRLDAAHGASAEGCGWHRSLSVCLLFPYLHHNLVDSKDGSLVCSL